MVGPAADAWLGFGGRIWIDETAQAFDEGVASDLVVDRLVAAPRLVRAGVRWRRTVAAAFAVLGALALAASWFAWSQYWTERQARSGLLAAESSARSGQRPDPSAALGSRELAHAANARGQERAGGSLGHASPPRSDPRSRSRARRP